MPDTVSVNDERLADTRALRALSRMSDAKENADPGKWEWSPSGSDKNVQAIIDNDGRVVTAYRADSDAPKYTESD